MGLARSFTLVAIPGLAALARDFAHLVLVMAGLDPAIHVLRLWRSRVSLRSPGISLK
jgi:hypothetical protein